MHGRFYWPLTARLIRWIVVGGALILAAGSARADLIRLGLFGGEEGLVLRDSDSGLEWLHLGATLTDPEHDPPILPDLTQWLEGEGTWSYASSTEICDLLALGDAAPSPCPSSGASQATPEAALVAIALLGNTSLLRAAGVFGTSGVVEASVDLSGMPIVHTLRVEEDAPLPLPPYGHVLNRNAASWETVPASTRQPAALPEDAPSFFGSFPYEERTQGGQVVEDGVTFRVWAPNSPYVAVVARSGTTDWTTYLSCETTAETACWPGPDLGGPLCPCPTGVWSGDVPDACVGDHYRYLTTSLDGFNVTKRDPRNRLTAGTWHNTRASVIYDPFNSLNPDPHVWTDQQFRRPRQEEVVIFHAALGDLSDNGTFAGAIEQLDDIRALGFNTIQLYPVMEYPTHDTPLIEFDPDDFCGAKGPHSSYIMSEAFAVESSYGGPDGYKHFVDQAHARNIAVHAEVKVKALVYWPLHDGIEKFDGWYSEEYPSGIYLSTAEELAEVPYRFNFGSQEVRDVLSDYIRMWLAEYHVDGFRFDQAGGALYPSICPEDNPDCEPHERVLLDTEPQARAWHRAIHEEMHRDYPDVVSIGENLYDRDLKGGDDGTGALFDARWYGPGLFGFLAYDRPEDEPQAPFSFPFSASRIAEAFEIFAEFDFEQAAFFPELYPGWGTMIKQIWASGACDDDPPPDPGEFECNNDCVKDPDRPECLGYVPEFSEPCDQARRQLGLVTALHLTMPALPVIDIRTLFLIPETYNHLKVQVYPIDWDAKDADDRIAGMWKLFGELIHLRRDVVDLLPEGGQPAGEDVPGATTGLTGSNITATAVDFDGDNKLLAYHRWRHEGPEGDVVTGDDVFVVANLGGVEKTGTFTFPAAGDWVVRLKTNDPRYGYMPENPEEEDPKLTAGLVNVPPGEFDVSLTLPKYTAVIFSQDCTPDTDGDGICDPKDNCGETPNRDQLDFDGDGLGDVCDNCTAVANPDQRDTNQDCYGNRCDADFNNDGIVGGPDFILFSASDGSVVGDSNYDPDIDMDGDGDIDGDDYNLFLPYSGAAPGPSGVLDDCNPSTPAYPQKANTIAASSGGNSLIGSGMFNSITLLLIPVGAIILLRLRRKK